jgi:hypothetical protein
LKKKNPTHIDLGQREGVKVFIPTRGAVEIFFRVGLFSQKYEGEKGEGRCGI